MPQYLAEGNQVSVTPFNNLGTWLRLSLTLAEKQREKGGVGQALDNCAFKIVDSNVRQNIY